MIFDYKKEFAEENMREKYHNYLVKCGYSLVTPSGKPSTVYDYQKRIERVCSWENTDWNGLSKQIDLVIEQYDAGGTKEDYGNRSHRAVINALKRFKECLNQ